LSHFEPMLREVFSRAPFDPRVLKEPARLTATHDKRDKRTRMLEWYERYLK